MSCLTFLLQHRLFKAFLFHYFVLMVCMWLMRPLVKVLFYFPSLPPERHFSSSSKSELSAVVRYLSCLNWSSTLAAEKRMNYFSLTCFLLVWIRFEVLSWKRQQILFWLVKYSCMNGTQGKKHCRKNYFVLCHMKEKKLELEIQSTDCTVWSHL